MGSGNKKITGLTWQQVEDSRARHGTNVLTPPRRRPVWLQFLDKFKDPLIQILLVALLLSVGISIYEYFYIEGIVLAKVFLEPLGIFLAILLATLIGFLVELNANKKFRLLNKMNDSVSVNVVRNGKVRQIERRDVVVGDVVLLEAGDKIPADGRLLKSVSLTVNESSFTGEPSVHKSHREQEKDTEATYPTDVVLRGSVVMEGNGVMEVSRVGDATEYGRIYTESQIENDVKTPLMKQLDWLGGWISRASYLVGALIVVGRIVAYLVAGDDLLSVGGVQYCLETVMLAVTLIVVSVPEGLPMSITLSLALSMRRMLQTGNLVRKMHACETMGATTVICTDKTGTLTQNQMQVGQISFTGSRLMEELNDEAWDRLIEASIAANSTAHLQTADNGTSKVIGNATEGALLLWLQDRGKDYLDIRRHYEIVEQLPFSTERKFMSSIVKPLDGEDRILLMKGAPEVVMKFCRLGEECQGIEQELRACQEKAMRTLAFAVHRISDGENVSLKDPYGLEWIGFVAISDPVRSDVTDAIGDCRSAGIDVKMVTGDTETTAREIGRQTGLCDDNDSDDAFITGSEFDLLSDEEAQKRVRSIRILSRARPSDKARLVKLLQNEGQVVAVTGDGTNDAPALNMAQVGLSMGSGTAVAKEASDITILDDSFASIARAVMWGRSLYKNIQRFIAFQLTVNVAACIIVGFCSFFSEQPPLTVTQMLWVNLIMDTLAALALASLPPQERVMKERPRRQSEAIITPAMKRFIWLFGVPIALVMTVLFVWFSFSHGNLSRHEVSIFFSTFVFFQFWNMLAARMFSHGPKPWKDIKRSKVFYSVWLAIGVCQILIVTYGGEMFAVEPLNFITWVMVIAGTLIASSLFTFILTLPRKKKE